MSMRQTRRDRRTIDARLSKYEKQIRAHLRRLVAAGAELCVCDNYGNCDRRTYQSEAESERDTNPAKECSACGKKILRVNQFRTDDPAKRGVRPCQKQELK